MWIIELMSLENLQPSTNLSDIHVAVVFEQESWQVSQNRNSVLFWSEDFNLTNVGVFSAMVIFKYSYLDVHSVHEVPIDQHKFLRSLLHDRSIRFLGCEWEEVPVHWTFKPCLRNFL